MPFLLQVPLALFKKADSCNSLIFHFPQDLDRCVTVFRAQKDDLDQPWVCIGKQRAHYKTINGNQKALVDSDKILDEILLGWGN